MEVETKPSFEASAAPSTSTDENLTKLGLCEVCAFRDAKYTCPRCEVKTCSLKCNKIHKLEVECDGQRDRTKFVPINKFTNLDLSSDYRLLEEVSRSIEVSRTKFGKGWDTIPKGLVKLKNAAKLQKVTLKFLPNKFKRHRNNTSELNFQTNIIHWHIDWIFANADNLIVSEAKVPETHKISSILNKYLVKQEDEVLQEKLQYYQAVGLPGVKILLKAEQKAGKKFYEIDPSQTLKEALEKKLIIEYPSMCVVLKDHSIAYDVIDSDDEEEKMEIDSQLKSGNQIVQSIINNAENDESLYKSLKNLLFVSEYSDEDLSGGE